VELSDPPEWPKTGTWRGRERALARLEEVTSELGATTAELAEARSVGDRVLAVFELRDASGSPTTPSGFAALLEVDADQILRMAVFRDRAAALDALEHGPPEPTLPGAKAAADLPQPTG
jgi:ketosteroid isomerase-like protein